MKSNHNNRFSEISSFEDFRIEKEQLDFKSRLIESRLKLTYLQVTERFSVSNMLDSLFQGIVLPKFSCLLSELIKKIGKDTQSSPEL